MLKNPFKYIAFLLILLPIPIFGQDEVSLYPVRFSQYYNSNSTLNPSALGAHSDIEISTSNKRLTGNFSNISTYFLNLGIRISESNRKIDSPISAVGFYLYNDKEGKYLNRTRVYLSYAWHGYINRNTKISGGFHMGAVNYSVKGTALSGDGSDIVPDASVGIRIYSETYYFGISYSQFFNSNIQPLLEIANLSPFANFTGGFDYRPTKNSCLRPVCAVRIPTNSDQVLVDANLLFTYKNRMQFSTGIHNNTNMVHSIGLLNLLPTNNLNVFLDYTYPINKTGINTNYMEFGLSYKLNKSK